MKKILSLLLVSLSLFILNWNTNASEECGLWIVSKECSAMENKISKVMTNFFKRYCNDSRKNFVDRIRGLDWINYTVNKIKKKSVNKKMVFGALELIEKNINMKIAQIKRMMNKNNIIGIWINTDENTNGITKISFKKEGQKIKVHMWGACHPTDCDWGEENFDSKNFTIKWDKWFVVRNQSIEMLNKRKIKVISKSVYADDRKDREFTYYFKKMN